MSKTQTYKVSEQDYVTIGKKMLMEVGVTEEDADIQIGSLLESDRKGIYTHGLFRLNRYVEQLKHHYIKPNPDIRKVNESETVDVFDGDHGLGAVVGYKAMREAIKKCKNNGVGIIGVHKSNHFGVAAHYAEMASKERQIGIVLTNASPAIAPTGSLKPLLGNNPWSISVPTHLGYPITLDMANSVASKGKIRVAKDRGEAIPLGWALDEKGTPTTDPIEALKGIILPVGDYKGYGITLMVEILAAVLTGSHFSEQMVDHDANDKRNVGHLFIAIDIEKFMRYEYFEGRLKELIESIKSSPRIQADREILLPGEREWQSKLNQEDGYVHLPQKLYEALIQLYQENGIEIPKSLLVEQV
ncbi:Ldh family oxidoreductase [Robertmurraya massiliosenegalensis]|uniref:Ldh family oxidoreductase n=1 Tax=Robertmurraya TaxID=2837507 RepID=UPI0039A60CEC